MLNLVNYQPGFDKIYLYAKDPYEVKYQFWITKQQSTDLKKNFNDSKAFIKYLNDMYNIYENNEENSLNKKCKILIVFDDLIADSLLIKELNLVVTQLFIRGTILNIYLVFITKSCSVVPE